MNNTKNTMSENRKALPKFLLILLGSTMIGFFVGMLSGNFSELVKPEEMVVPLHDVLVSASPYMIWLVTIVLCGLAIYKYSQAKKLYQGWDEEDEDVIHRAEMQINWSILFSNFAMILNFFFFGALMILSENFSLLGLFGFILSMAIIVIMQQKNVDLVRKINPEKKGSVYDSHFQKKWMDSCDENEVRLVGQAAFKSFTVTNYVCIVLWLIILIVSSMVHAGIFAMVVVTIIWAVLQGTFILESMRLSK